MTAWQFTSPIEPQEEPLQKTPQDPVPKGPVQHATAEALRNFPLPTAMAAASPNTVREAFPRNCRRAIARPIVFIMRSVIQFAFRAMSWRTCLVDVRSALTLKWFPACRAQN